MELDCGVMIDALRADARRGRRRRQGRHLARDIGRLAPSAEAEVEVLVTPLLVEEEGVASSFSSAMGERPRRMRPWGIRRIERRADSLKLFGRGKILNIISTRMTRPSVAPVRQQNRPNASEMGAASFFGGRTLRSRSRAKAIPKRKTCK